MRLSGKVLQNVIDINHWQYTDQAYLSEGQINEFYIQLVDLSQDVNGSTNGEIPANPLRYISSATVISVMGIFESLRDYDNGSGNGCYGDSGGFSITATQPFANDKSIFKFTISSIRLPKSGNLKIKVTEDQIDRYFIIKNAISMQLLNIGSC